MAAASYKTTRTPVTTSAAAGLRRPNDWPETKALEGLVRTRHGFVSVLTTPIGTILQMVVDGFLYTRSFQVGPMPSKGLIGRAGRFASDVHAAAKREEREGNQ